MNSLKRYKEDLALTEYGTRVIRSHRKPATGNVRRTFTAVLLISATVTGLSTSVNGFTEDSPASADASGSTVVILAEETATVPPGLVYPLTDDELTNEIRVREEATARKRIARQTAERARQQLKLSRIEVVIKYALAQQGDRYRFATAGPNSFDCSGLVLAAYKQIGVKLPHFTGAMIKLGSKVSRSNLKRGDIVFPQHGHVGIYLGGGQMIHASGSRQKVVVGKVYGFYAARRLV